MSDISVIPALIHLKLTAEDSSWEYRWMHTVWNETPVFFFLRVEKLARVIEVELFHHSFYRALKMPPREKSEWGSGGLFLQDLKGGVLDIKTKVRVQTLINNRPL